MEGSTVVPIPISLGGPRTVDAFLVRGSRPILVDTGVPGMAPRILEALTAEGVDPRDVALILITHAHTDHTGSLPELVEATGAPVIVQRMDAPALEAGESAPVVGRTPEAQASIDQMAQRRAERAKAMRGVTPSVVVEEELSLAPYGIAGRVIHTPGHTEGGLTLLLDSAEAIVGDLIGSEPADPSVPAPAMYAVNAAEMDESIRRVIAERPERVYTGHAGSFTLEQLVAAFGS
jgi:hydroxyacylglutathione hydrolase